jgi:hypothetical protein
VWCCSTIHQSCFSSVVIRNFHHGYNYHTLAKNLIQRANRSAGYLSIKMLHFSYFWGEIWKRGAYISWPMLARCSLLQLKFVKSFIAFINQQSASRSVCLLIKAVLLKSENPHINLIQEVWNILENNICAYLQLWELVML